jgi:hypothetical protein
LKTDWNKTRAAMIAARVFPLIFNILHFFPKKTQFLFFYFKKSFHFYGRLLNAIENIFWIGIVL